MGGYKGQRCNSSSSSTLVKKCYLYGEWISIQQCNCGREMVLKTSWTDENPSRRFWECSRCKDGSCGFVKWYDSPMCPRSKRIIHGLLKRINRDEEEIAMLKAKLKSVVTMQEMKDKRRARKFIAMIVVIVMVVLFGYVVLGNNEIGMNVPMLP